MISMPTLKTTLFNGETGGGCTLTSALVVFDVTLVLDADLHTGIRSIGKFAQGVTGDTRNSPDPMLMARDSIDPPLHVRAGV